MDIGELLSFKPNVNAKRELAGDANEVPTKVRKQTLQISSEINRSENRHIHPNTTNAGKVHLVKEQATSQNEFNDETEEERSLRVLEEWEKRVLSESKEAVEIEEFDDQKVKKLILTFEKKVFKNQEMRIKFPDNPERFMESELDLNDIIIEMKTLATMPEQYHYLIELRCVSSMLSLINHANADISTALIELLQELTDVDTLTESEEGAEVLMDALIDGQIASLMVQNFERLDEAVKEEATGVHNSLAVIENILEIKPESGPVIGQQGLLGWLLKRLKMKQPLFDANKLYSAEILSILLQGSDEVRQRMGEMDGIDVILQQLASFKRHDPSGLEEIEFMENMFNCLCSSLLYPGNRDKFLNGEGLQLMNLMLREKKMSRNSALKVLDHAMTGSDGANNCAKFVDILGLRTLFPLFMKPPKKNKKIGASVKDHEEHIVSIIASMLINLKGSHKQRLVAKFSENDYAKVDRLMELHFKYYERVQKAENKIDRERSKLIDDDDKEEYFYLKRLDAGLFSLQQTDYIIVDICASGSSQIKQRALHILNLRGGSVKSIRSTLREYAGSIGEDNSSEEALAQQIIALADKF